MADESINFGVADFLANPAQPVGPALKDSLASGVAQNPDTTAKIKAYARSLGVPLPAALGDPGFVQTQGRVQELDPNGMVLTSPKTATWLSQPDNAAVAHDDVDVLKNIEQTVKNLGGIVAGSAHALAEVPYDAAQAVDEALDPFGQFGLAQHRELDPRTGKFTVTGPQTAVQAEGARIRKLAQSEMPTTENWMQAGVNSGVASLLQNAPGVILSIATRNPELGLALMAGQTGLQSYGEGRDNGLDPAAAAGHGAKQGAIEGLTEMLPMEALIKDLKAGSGVIKTWMHQLATDVPGEITATVMQNYNDWADMHPEKPFSDYLAQLPADIGATVIATAMGTAGHTAMEQVAHAAARHVDQSQAQAGQAAQAQQVQGMLDGLVKAAGASALRERDPQTFKEFVDAASQDTPVDRVYINAHDLVNTLAQGSPEQLADDAKVLEAMPSVIPQLDDAVKSGGLVEIPVSELLAFTPDTHLGQAMMEHLKVDPEAMSMAEAQEFLQTHKESFQAEVQKIVEDKGVADQFLTSAEAVRQGIKGQLDQVNRFTPDVNEAYASFVSQAYATQASRLNITPEELFSRHPLTVQAQGVTEGSLMNQEPSAKPLDEAMRDGLVLDLPEGQDDVNAALPPANELEQRAPRPPSLTTAIRHEGRLYTGRTHLEALTKIEDQKQRQRATLDGDNRVFVTERGKVLDRFKAADYAASFGLYRKDMNVPRGAKRGPELISEDLEPQGNGPELNQSQAHIHYEPGLGFQSTLFNTVMSAKQAKASADQWLAMLHNAPGVKKEELEWIGLPEALTLMGQDGAISREQILTYIAQNGVRLEEVMQRQPSDDDIEAKAEELADAARDAAIQNNEYDGGYYVTQQEAEDDEGNPITRWAINDSEHSQDHYDTEEEAQEAADELNSEGESAWLDDNFRASDYEDEARRELEYAGGAQYAEYQAIPGGENYREVLLILPRKNEFTADGDLRDVNPRLTRDFTAGMGHWDHDNVLAHIRLADFTTPGGGRVLGVLEIQSDWHQKGRDKGYAQPASPEEKAAAQTAWDDALTQRNAAGAELGAALMPLLQERLQELEEQRNAAANAEEPAKAELDRIGLEYDRATGELNTTKPETVPPYKAAEAAYAEAHKKHTELMQVRQRAAENVNRMKSHLASIERAKDEPYTELLHHLHEAASSTTLWSGTDLVEQFAEVMQLDQALTNATLKFREAGQRLERSRGEKGVPDAPFKTAWPALSMKRVIQEAVAKGYDHVAWATGEQQADLYDMREQIGRVMIKAASGEGALGPYEVRVKHSIAQVLIEGGHAENEDESYGGGFRSVYMTPEKIREVFGGELGGKLLEGADKRLAGDDYYIAEGDDLVGGEGHKAFYNRNLVNITNDIVKKMGAKVGPVELRNAGAMRSLNPLTAMEQAALEEAQRPETPAPRTPHDIKAEAAAIAAADPSIAQHLQADGTYAHPRLEELRNELRLSHALIRYAELQKAALKQWGFPITDKMREDERATKPALFQATGAPGENRGSFNPQTGTITLLRGADLSTFLHETGHFFLEMLAKLAADEHAPQAIKDDWDKAASFIGFNGADPAAWLAIPVDARRDGHEKWARGFEAYLREGRAPAPALKAVFQRFKAWLLHVYQDLSQLHVELTDEVRGVFDRLLASEQDIAQAERTRHFAPVLETKPEGMTDVEWEAYQRLGAEATADAQDQLQARSIRDMRWLQNTRARLIRTMAKEAREKRQAMRAEVTAEVTAEPVYAAQQFLKRGLVRGEAAEGPHKLGLPELRKMYGEAPTGLEEATGQKALPVDYRKLGFGKYGMLAEEGLAPDHVAELFGFTSGDELVRALLSAEPMNTKVEGLTDQRMLERYGDLTDADAIARAADEAIHNDARLRFVATEANALAKAAGKPRMMAEAARDFAAQLIGRQKIRDLKPAKYTGAETKAAVAAARAHGKGDLVEAATQKRNQLINGYAARAAMNAQQEVEKALRYFARMDSAATRKGMDPDYRDQIDQLLERFDLRKGQSLKAIDKRKSLASWIKAMEDRGLEPILDDELVNEAYRKHYKDLTVDEMRGLLDAVKNIAHLGRLKNRLLVAARGRAFQAVVDESEAAIRDNAYQTKPEKVEHNTVGDRLLSGAAAFFAQHRKLSSLIREMSGLKTEGGILWRAFIEPMNQANDREAGMREAATRSLMDIFKPIATAGGLRQKLFIPEIGKSLSLEGRLAVALNWGNELNRARIMDGDKWTADQVAAILRTLTAGQLEFVNKLHEYLDSYWPQIAAKERRVTGVEPEKVEAEPYQLLSADGHLVDMRGGYYPIKYDTERSTRSEQDNIAEAVRASLRGVYTRATTRRGHTKARVDKVERPVRKDLSVPFGHVNQVIHDLAFHEYLIDANRLIAAPQIDAAIRDHYGVEVLRTMRNTIDAIAEGDTQSENQLERVVNYVRTGTTIVGLGFNLLTALQQPLGLTQSIVRIGPKYMAKGTFRVMGDAVTLQNTMKEIAGKSEFMRLRANTMMREIAEVQNQVKSKVSGELAERVLGKHAGLLTGTLDAAQGSAFYLITKLQLVADVPTWLGAYAKAQDQGQDEDTAVKLADQAVRDSQGSGQTGDLAQIQRGSVWFKLWTSFYSFFSIGYNQMAESLAETRRVGPARLPLLAADVALVAILPAVLGELMKRALRGDDWDWDELGPALLKNQVAYMLGFMVGVRDLGQIITSDGKNAGGPASLRIFADTAKLYQQAKQGELDDAFRKAALNTGGILFHFPAAQINRTVDGLEAMAKGETANPMALLLGPPQHHAGG